MGCNLEHEASVFGEPFDISFISGVDEDRGCVFGATPMLVIDKVPLLECLVALGIEIEVV